MKCKQIFLTLMLLLFSAFTLLSGTACTKPETPQGEVAEDAWKHKVTNTEILETEVFLDVPDSVVYYDGSFENAVVLSGEDAATIFSAFMELSQKQMGTSALKGYIMISLLPKKIEKVGAIEFRYDQRRAYVGDPLERQLPGKRTYRWHFGKEGPFDALLIVPDQERHLMVIPYCDGEYHSRMNYTVRFTSQFDAFMAVWNEVLAQ